MQQDAHHQVDTGHGRVIPFRANRCARIARSLCSRPEIFVVSSEGDMYLYHRLGRALAASSCLILLVTSKADPAPGVARSITVSEGTNLGATVSPDRKTIILDLQTALWALPFEGGAARRLTEPELEASRPDFSPTGSLIAFQSFSGGTFHIWVMKPDGSGRRELTEGHGDDRDPRVSPDGARIAFSSDRAMKGNYDIWTVEVATGKLAQWTSDPSDEYEPAWSPDGMEIAYVSGAGAIGHAVLAAKAGGQPRVIIEAPDGSKVNAPSWSPDGKQIAYVQTTANKLRLLISGKQVGSAEDVFPFPAVWLSATRILYTGNGKIWKTQLATNTTENVPFKAAFAVNRAAYKRNVPDFDTTAPRTAKGILAPALSPDGKRIVFEALNQLWLMEIGGEATPLTNDGYYKQTPVWSPDGKRIAYSSDKNGTANVYILDLATQAEKRVTNLHEAAALDPVWSPDGTQIAFQTQEGTVHIADLASGGSREVIRTTFEPGRPSWSKNGKVLSLAVLRAYTKRYREGTSLILTADLQSGKQVLTEPAPYKSITTRSIDGPIYSPDGTRMAYVMDDYLWVRPVDANGLPVSEARPINEEMTDAPSWSADGKRMLYLSAGTLRMIEADGKTPPVTVPVNLTWRRQERTKTIVVHAGTLWDGKGAAVQKEVDVTIVGRRIRKVEPHNEAAHRSAETVVDGSSLALLPGLWEAHNHRYGGQAASGDRAGRIWLAYGFTTLQSQGDAAYAQMEVKESFAAGARVGPRYFAAGEPIDGERQYYGHDHGATNEKELKLELERARALEYDNLKTYVRLPHKLQKIALDYAHNQLGIWAASHYGMPGLGFGMDGMTHVSATSRWGYSYTRSAGGATYDDIRQLFAATGEFLITTPFTASALYAEDPRIVEDARVSTLNTPWAQKTMVQARDRAVSTNQTTSLEGLQSEMETVLAVMRGGGTVALGTDSPLPSNAILNHLGLRAEVKYGLKPWEALQTVTLLPARAFGYEKDLGTVEPGKLADMILVAGNPLGDIRDTANVRHVIVDGRVYTIPEILAPFAHNPAR
uniref:Amidohydrolase n=1 Tax=Solibacter usitatus (strain Ellin6076) TaxID=234267 RepID=Q026W9_SOLUE